MGKPYIAEERFATERRMLPFRKSRGVGRLITAGALGDPLFQWFSTVVAFGVIGLLVVITVILSLAASESIRAFGLGFLTGAVLNPVPPLVFGSLPFVYGTLVTSALALLFGVPISIGIAIFLSELSPPWLRIPLTYVVELLAAVPSVVYGLWGVFVLGPVLRYARAGIFGAVILRLGRAVGETMAVTMTIGNRNAISVSLFDQGQTIASWIANNFLNATDPLELSALIELGLVLMLMSLVINIFARLMLGRVLRRGEGSA